MSDESEDDDSLLISIAKRPKTHASNLPLTEIGEDKEI